MKTKNFITKNRGVQSAAYFLNTYLKDYPWLHKGKENAIKAMEDYAEQFLYNFSEGCECKESTGETWCCNMCGLPTNKHTEKDVVPNPSKELIREVIMRQQLALPETEQDLKWHEQKPDKELMIRLFEYLELGNSTMVKTYPADIEPHYFVRHNLDTNDRFCDKCGLYFTDEIHKITL